MGLFSSIAFFVSVALNAIFMLHLRRHPRLCRPKVVLTRENQPAGQFYVPVRMESDGTAGGSRIVHGETGQFIAFGNVMASSWHMAFRPGDEVAFVKLELGSVPIRYMYREAPKQELLAAAEPMPTGSVNGTGFVHS